jgi:hypothetical protein
MRRRALFLFLATSLIVLPSLCAAAVPWQPMGTPNGALVLALTFDSQVPGVVLAGTYLQGMYRSTDGGASWRSVSDDLWGIHFMALAAGPGVIYAGTESIGLYVSRDHGMTWVLSGVDRTIRSVATDPAHPGTVYVTASGLQKSTDAGRHWKRVSQPSGLLTTLAVDGGSPSIVYALTENSTFEAKIWRSLNGGSTWSAVGPTLPSLSNSLVVDPVTHVAYLGTESGLLISKDRGATWRPARGWPARFGVSALAARARTVYAGAVDKTSRFTGRGAYVSKDGGSTWSPASQGLGQVRARVLAVAPNNPKAVVAGADGWGAFKSLSSGTSWTLASRGLGTLPIARIAPDPFQPGTFYAGAFSAGVWKTSSAGASWQPLRPMMLEGAMVMTLAPDPHRRNRIYAGTNGALARSLDGGLTWTLLDGGLHAAGFSGQLLVDPLRPSTLYAGTRHGLFRSGDGGETWSPGAGAECTFPAALAIAPAGTVYLAGLAIPGCGGSPSGGVLLTSDDGGLTWAFRGSLPEEVTPTALVVDPASASTLYLSTWGLFRSTDGGVTWQPVTQFASQINSLVFGGSDLRTLYAGLGIYQGARASRDGGATWASAGSGLFETTVDGLFWDSLAGVLYAATDRGLFSLQPGAP